ncbi:hypothetical protein HDV01_001168 [Terramyces sp. JEL0728]|nr:hypothetical protein HDV01_001168 [Terramyces sp. JEL0728]
MIETQREMTGLLMTLLDPYLEYILNTVGEVIKSIPDKPYLKTSLKCKSCFAKEIECSHRYTHILSIINPKTINNHVIQKPVKNQYYVQSKYFYDQMFKLIEQKYHEYSKTNKNQVKLGNIQKQFLRKCPPFCYYCQYCKETERGYQKPKHKQTCMLYVPIRVLAELEWTDYQSAGDKFTVYQREKYFEISGDYKKRYPTMNLSMANRVLNELIVKETRFDPKLNELNILFEPGSALEFKFGIKTKNWVFEKQKLMVKEDMKLYDVKNRLGSCIGTFVNGALETQGLEVTSPLTPTSVQEFDSPMPVKQEISKSSDSISIASEVDPNSVEMAVEETGEILPSKRRFKRIKIEYLLNHDEDANLLLNFAETTNSSY